MKTINASIRQNSSSRYITSKGQLPAIAAAMRNILTLSSSGLIAIAIITLSVWAAGTDIAMYLGAGTWGVGFIFLGVAVDSRGRAALLQSITGISLLVLALLQNYVSPDFIIASGVLLATWLSVVSFKRMSV